MQIKYYWFNYILYCQFRIPWFHSWKRPITRIIKKIILVINQIFKLENFIVKIIGSKRVISTSKIRKIIVIKKNRNENGIRELLIGLNPHSNGDIFSRFNFIFFEIIVEIFIIIKGIISIMIKGIVIKIIIYIKY